MGNLKLRGELSTCLRWIDDGMELAVGIVLNAIYVSESDETSSSKD